jgi:hypothetical protein
MTARSKAAILQHCVLRNVVALRAQYAGIQLTASLCDMRMLTNMSDLFLYSLHTSMHQTHNSGNASSDVQV